MSTIRPIAVRAADARDYASLAALVTQFTGLGTTAAQVAARLQKSEGVEHTFVATFGDDVAGLACLKLTHVLGEDGLCAEVSDLFVEPRFRQRGVAAALLSHLEERARAAGALGWSVIVDPGNAAAVALYRKQGFDTFAVAMQRWFSDERPFKPGA